MNKIISFTDYWRKVAVAAGKILSQKPLSHNYIRECANGIKTPSAQLKAAIEVAQGDVRDWVFKNKICVVRLNRNGYKGKYHEQNSF